MAIALFHELFGTIDTVTQTYVNDMSSRAAAQMAPVVGTALPLTFLAFGMLIVRGAVQMPVSEFLGKSIRIAMIVGVALGSGLYQSNIASAIRTTPDALASALVPGGTPGQTAADLIDNAAGTGFDKAGEAYSNVSLFKADGLVYALLGTVILVSTVIFVALGGAFLLLAKLGVAVLAGLGPMFVLALLFQPTHRFFEAWAGQVVNMCLMVVLFAASFGLMLQIYGHYVEDLAFDGATDMISAVGAIAILAVAMVVALLQLPGIASALGAGASVGFLYELRAVAGGAKAGGRAGGALASGAGNAAAAGMKGGRAAASTPGGFGARAGAGVKAIAGHYKGRKAA